jgi:UDP-glucose 6-dehydrogenase
MVSETSILFDIKNHWKTKNKKSEINNRVSVLKSIDFKTKVYDAVSIITEWEEFKKINWKGLKNTMKIFDGRNIIDLD